MKYILMCPQCGEIMSVEDPGEAVICLNCKEEFSTTTGNKLYYNYKVKLLKAANQSYVECYDYKLANTNFGIILKVEPTDLDALTGYELSLLKLSTLKKNTFKEYIDVLNNSDIVLGHETYIRLGHFFEESYELLFIYQRKVIAKYTSLEDTSAKSLMLKNFLELYELYNFIASNLEIFKHEELADSFYLDSEVISKALDEVKSILQASALIGDGKNYKDTLLVVNGVTLPYSAIEPSSVDIEDEVIYNVVNNMAMFKYSFAILVAFVVLIIVGFLLMITNATALAGYILTPIAFAGFFLTYYLNKVIRSKNLNKLDK
ncbi:MAG: hypothetical protein RSB95_04775 [Bacilli bacterium]